MKNLATKLIYIILFFLITFIGGSFFYGYTAVKETSPSNTVSPFFALIIVLVILGALTGITMYCVNYYKNGDVAKARADIAVILGQLPKKWNLEYLGQLMLVLNGQTEKGIAVEIGFLPLPLRVGATNYRMFYGYKGVSMSSITLKLPEDRPVEPIKNALEQIAKDYPGKVNVYDQKVVYLSDNTGVVDNNTYRKFFQELAIALD